MESSLNEVLSFNESFVKFKQYEPFITSKYPTKKVVILTCMDARLVELLPKAMNMRNGDAKIVKSAGAQVSHPFGAVMRSLLVAVYELKADEIYVVGHHDCGMSAIDPHKMINHMIERGVNKDIMNIIDYTGIDLVDWLHGFGDVSTSVLKSVDIIRNHPLMPKSTPVHGLVMDPGTGKLDLLSDGNAYLENLEPKESKEEKSSK
ncbi:MULTISPECIES: carbonic anhydrase [Lysinibacillus]|uniref:carbonic anhydrase n=1 Tax=Lysinibacillus antri TaxID=2498145 RepID=A0A432LAL7_9BACI|nr:MULTISPECIES: carbonic anhydrase [Lysinibacillus]RUL51604.1 carbonic anhydrase [Lysinibacillus antri]TSI10645.1 carbonic anhydrase [Lysinibacillus sp. BW-2-10]